MKENCIIAETSCTHHVFDVTRDGRCAVCNGHNTTAARHGGVGYGRVEQEQATHRRREGQRSTPPLGQPVMCFRSPTRSRNKPPPPPTPPRMELCSVLVTRTSTHQHKKILISGTIGTFQSGRRIVETAVLSPGTVCNDVHPHSVQPTQNTVSSDTVLFSFSVASS